MLPYRDVLEITSLFLLSDKSSNGICSPSYQLSSLVALWADSSPLVMTVDTRDCKYQCSSRHLTVITHYTGVLFYFEIWPALDPYYASHRIHVKPAAINNNKYLFLPEAKTDTIERGGCKAESAAIRFEFHILDARYCMRRSRGQPLASWC